MVTIPPNPQDPQPHLDNLTADTHCCGTNSLESVVTEFESSEEGYRVPTKEQVGDSPEIWESPAVPFNGVRCEAYDYSDGSNVPVLVSVLIVRDFDKT
jgi:hypothetical protein